MGLSRRAIAVRSLLAASAIVAAAVAQPAAAATKFEWVSTGRDPGSVVASGGRTVLGMSGNGRFVAFRVSYTDTPEDGLNLPPLINAKQELWLADLQSKKQTKVADLDPLYGLQYRITLSYDGRYLAFTSGDARLVPRDTNSRMDVYLYDARANRVRRMLDVNGDQLTEGATGGIVTSDGKFVIYESRSDVLAKHNQQAPPCTVYKHSLVTNTTTPVVVSGIPICTHSDGHISANRDGRYIAVTTLSAFSREDNMSRDVYWIDTVARRAVMITAPELNGDNKAQEPWTPMLDGSGSIVAYEYQGQGISQIIVRKVKNGSVIDVTSGLLGPGSAYLEDPQLSEDGRWLTYSDSSATATPSVYVRDLTKDLSATTRLEPFGECVSERCGAPVSRAAVPSANGKTIAFLTFTGHAAGDDDYGPDVYVARR